jgi:hypothetical protein
MSEILEAMARTWFQRFHGPEVEWNDETEAEKEVGRREAQAALRAGLEAAGVYVNPHTPSDWRAPRDAISNLVRAAYPSTDGKD